MKNENNILRAAIRHSLLQDGQEASAPLSGEPNWNHLLWLADRHRITPLLYRFLKNGEHSPEAPPNILEQLKNAYEANANEELSLKRLAILLFQQREWGNRLILKGDILYSAAIYPTSSLKRVRWLNCSVAAEIHDEVKTALITMGFSPSQGEENVYHDKGRQKIVLTLAEEVSSNPFFRNDRDLSNNSEKTSCVLGNIAIQNSEASLLALILKASAHAWRLWEYVADMCALLASAPCDGELLMRQAKSLEMERMTVFALLFGKRLVNAPIPHGITEELTNCPHLEKLAETFEEKLFRGEWMPDNFESFLQQRNSLLDDSLQKSTLPHASTQGKAPRTFGEYVSTPPPLVERMLEIAGLKSSDVIYDLGCGDGRFLVYAAEKYGCRGVGVDNDPERVQEAEEMARRKGVEGKVRFYREDVLQTDLSEASVIVSFLNEIGNLSLLPKFQQELKAGTRIITQQFALGNTPPDYVEIMRTGMKTAKHIYLWRV